MPKRPETRPSPGPQDAGAARQHTTGPLRWLLPALLALAVACAWLGPLDDQARQQAEDGLKRALASYALARTLNAGISVAQGTALSAQPLGIGLTLTPGQMLDPLNDLVEQFSGLLLAASIAFGIQLLLLKMSLHWSVSLLLSSSAALWAWHWLRASASGWPGRLLVALLLLRFIVPLAGAGSGLAYAGFMHAQFLDSQRAVASASESIGSLALSENPEAKWWQLGKQAEKLDLPGQLEKFQSRVDQAIEHTIHLAVVFLLQTLLLPLAVIWVLLRAGRALTAAGGT